MARTGKRRPEVYVSTDIETDGPIPGKNTMLSLGSVAFDAGGAEIGAIQINLEPLPEATPDPRTMDWWKGQPDAWAAATVDQEPPERAIARCAGWVDGLPGSPVFVAYPLLFDMMFVYWYLIRFVGRSPFSHSGIDIKTMAYIGMGGTSYRDATKRNMPRAWMPRRRHTHVAVDDAREQGHLFFNIRRALSG